MSPDLATNLVNLAIWNGVFLLLGVTGALVAKQHFRPRWLLAALVLFNLNIVIVLNIFGQNSLIYHLVGDSDVTYNWAGKGLAILVTCAVLASGRLPLAEAGVTLRQARKAWIGWTVIAVLCLIEIGLALNIPDEPQTVETFAFQLTIPSLDEELLYRGVMLYCLVRAFGEGPRALWANFGIAALISTLMFTMVHSLFWTGDSIGFSMEAFLFTSFCGFVLA